jgi:hypothetical protein
MELVMAANELHDISRLLGNLESGLASMNHRFDKLEDRMDERDDTLSDMRDTLEANTNDTRYLKDVLLKDIKPVTDDVRRWRLMGMGALAIVGVGGAAIGSTALWLWDHAAAWIKWGP